MAKLRQAGTRRALAWTMESRGVADALLDGHLRLIGREETTSGMVRLVFESHERSLLTSRETALLAAAETGVANKRLAAIYALSRSTVSELLKDAIGKLGIANRSEFLDLMGRLRATGSELQPADPRENPAEATRYVLCPSAPASASPPAPWARLTPAERQVAGAVLKGSSNDAIAAARRTSARTVANQLAAIYRKLGVSSRWELAAHLSKRAFTVA
jgi:DNA-binding NarL/FixJ family response regulator